MRPWAALAIAAVVLLLGCSQGSPETEDPTAPVSVAPGRGDAAAAENPSADEAATTVEDLLGVFRGAYPGAVVRVGNETRVVSGGRAVIGEQGRITERHRFPVGSVTKTMVATAVLQLVEEGDLSLTDSVER